MRVAVLVFPQRFQVQPADWAAAVAAYHLRPDAFDLMRPNRRIRAWCDATGVPLLDPTGAMRAHHVATGEDLYLPARGHALERGGPRAWFEGAREGLEPLLRGAMPRP